MRQFMAVVFAGLVVTLGFGCSDAGDSPTSPREDNNNGVDTLATFTEVQAVMAASCNPTSGTCHGATGASGYPFTSYESIVNNQSGIGISVDPGNGAGSNLYLKTTASPPFGQRMPLVGDTLTTEQQLLIKAWIDQGALNN